MALYRLYEKQLCQTGFFVQLSVFFPGKFVKRVSGKVGTSYCSNREMIWLESTLLIAGKGHF